MITVSILINNKPLFTRTAVNVTAAYVKKYPGGLREGYNVYRSDDGQEIFHRPDDGALKLGKKMLDTIKEP